MKMAIIFTLCARDEKHRQRIVESIFDTDRREKINGIESIRQVYPGNTDPYLYEKHEALIKEGTPYKNIAALADKILDLKGITSKNIVAQKVNAP